MTATPTVYTVSQLNARIANLINADRELQAVFVEGELSNVNINSKSGHMYFSVKDKTGVIRAVMFAWAMRSLRFRPVDGMKVIMRAQVTVYEPAGQYQLRVEDMQPDGVGALAMQLEQLKKKLSAEGLFAQEHKKPIPRFPKVVGVITSPTGAAIRDIMNILRRRYPCARIVLAPVLVQGEEAPAQLINAVRLFSDNRAADVLIIGRGGGSMEDLWAFNDEGLARAIYDCEIPVISAVGHETDTTICDFVSDLRAPTPSAAAELAVPDRLELTGDIRATFRRGAVALNAKLSLMQTECDRMKALVRARVSLSALESRAQTVDSLSVRAENAAQRQLSTAASATAELAAKCEALNPMAVLNRGFAYIMSGEKSMYSAQDAKKGDILDITLKDGSIKAEVL